MGEGYQSLYFHPKNKCRDDAPENQMKSRFFLDIVVAESATVLELLSGKDKTLLIRRDTGKKILSILTIGT